MVAIGWVETEALDTLWPQSAQLDEDDIELFLQSAYEACQPWAPAVTGAVPHSFKLAQVMHAKHLSARFRTGNKDTIGPDGYTISTYPLVLESRQLLRPKRPAFKRIR